jgi:uncharacterized membrane protein
VAINNKQSRDTGNIGNTTHRRTTMKAKEQHSKQKGQSIINVCSVVLLLWLSSVSCVVCPMLPVSLDCLLLTVPSVCCVVPLLSLSSFCVLCSQCCLYLWIVYNWLSLLKAKEQHSKQKRKSIINNPEIQATLGTQHTEGRQWKQKNNTANRRESQLSIIDFPFCLLCCSFALIVILLYRVCPMLSVSLDCLSLIASSVFCIVFLFCRRDSQ